MIFTDIGYAATALFALAVASLAALAWLAWRADRHDPLTVVIARPVPEVIDDALPLFFERRTQAAPWPDGDTVTYDGMATELNEILKGRRAMTETTFRRKYGSGHSYTLDGVPKIKGVTTMMKGLGGPPESYFTKYTAGYAVDNWDRLAQLPPSQRLEEIAGATKTRFNSAAVRGTEVHKLAEKLAHGEQVSVPDHLRGYVESAVQFLDDYDVKADCTEVALFSRRNKHAGSADAFGSAQKPDELMRTRILLDWKTTAKEPWGSVAFQFSGYRYSDFMLSGDGGKDSTELAVPEVDECWAVWLQPDRYEVFPMHVTPEVYRELLYIDQCRMADGQCREYKLDALPKPDSVRKVRLADAEEEDL